MNSAIIKIGSIVLAAFCVTVVVDKVKDIDKAEVDSYIKASHERRNDARVSTLEDTVKKLQDENAKLKSEATELRSQLSKANVEKRDFEMKNANLTQEIKGLRESISNKNFNGGNVISYRKMR